MIQREGAENVAEKPRAYEFLFTDTPIDNDREQTEGAGPHKSEPGRAVPFRLELMESGAMPQLRGVAPE